MNQLACLQDRCWKSNNWSGTKTRAREEDNIIKTHQHATSLNLRRETVCLVWWGGCGEKGQGSSSGVSKTIFLPVFVRLLLIFAYLLLILLAGGCLLTPQMNDTTDKLDSRGTSNKGSLKKTILLLTFVNNGVGGGLEQASSIKKTIATIP